MFKPGAIHRITFVGITVFLTPLIVWCQSSNPSEKPNNVRSEKKDAYKRWIDEDVPYIITPAERTAFLALKTDEERENFIAIFWGNRDTNPDTEENEYREEYYQRVAYANEHFASGTPGWRTDRGRIFITWGKPDSVEAHPSGGSYDRPSYEGGGSTSTYPFETWFYRHLDNVGDGIEIEFVDPTSSGEYRIARDADEKDALKYVPGAGLKSAEILGLSNKAERLIGESGQSYQREQDTFFSRMRLQKDLSNPPAAKLGELQDGIASSGSGNFLDKEPINIDFRVDFFRQSDDHVITAFTLQANNKDLQFDNAGGLQTAKLNILGQITTVAGKRSAIFEDSVTATATNDELISLRDKKSIYQKAVALRPGTYKVDVLVRDVVTGNKGTVRMGFVVPRYDEKNLSTSSLVLASTLRSTREWDTGQSFVIGKTKVIPNLSGIYKQGQEIGVYLQVYNAGIDQTTLRPSSDVEYVLIQDGKVVMRQPEDWSGLSESGNRLTVARLLPTIDLQPGDYEIKVLIKDRVGGQVIENKGKFTIIQ